MKKKIYKVVLAAVISASIAAVPANAASWQKNNTGWWYRENNGTYPKNKWKKIGGQWYWFDARGYMVTGWKKIDGKWYYFQSGGAMLGQGWHWIGNSCYYMYASGAMAENTWIGNDYVNGSGAWVKGKVKEQPRWVKSGERWWYRHADGSYTKNNWEKISGQWYLFDKEGWMLTGWQMKSGKWYYLKQDGVMAADTWIDYKYVNASGEREDNHAHKHECDETVLKQPECGEPGKKKLICKLCGEEKIEEIPALKHEYKVVKKVAPTCTKKGYDRYWCPKCGDEYDIVMKATGHDYHWKSNGDETMSYVCVKCGEVSETKACSYVKSKEIASTCKVQGYTEYTCAECGDVKKEMKELTEHDWILIEDKGNQKTYECKICGDEKIVILAEKPKDDTSGEVIYDQDKAYTIDLGNGQTTKVVGHFDNEMAEDVFKMLNAYRTENGMKELKKGKQPLEEAANTRAVEITYLFDHKRPNGERALTSFTGSTGCMAENIAQYQTSAEAVMNAWKESPSHNSNMLSKYPTYVSIGVFAKYVRTVEEEPIYSYHFVQLFGW